jgi:hypothetical protein
MSVLTTPLHVHAFKQVDATPITSDHILPIVDRQRGAGDGARLVGGKKHHGAAISSGSPRRLTGISGRVLF